MHIQLTTSCDLMCAWTLINIKSKLNIILVKGSSSYMNTLQDHAKYMHVFMLLILHGKFIMITAG